MKKYFTSIVIASIVAILFIILYYEAPTTSEKKIDTVTDEVVQEKTYKFGFDIDKHRFHSNTIKENQFLSNILTKSGVSYQKIDQLVHKAKDVYNVRKIQTGKNYHVVMSNDTCTFNCKAFIYEPNPLEYVVYSFDDSISVELKEHEYDVCFESAAGEIKSSLWNAMLDLNVDPYVIDLMEDALASSVSFYHTKVGDQFKVIYEQKYIDGKPVALGKLLGAYYKNNAGEHYSVYYESEKYKGFYDMDGRPSKKSFLLSPIRAGRISSRYNLRRLHPIKRRRIPHKGTDYAAPYGTPIRAVANGVVTIRSRTRGNGKYVKIKHDKTYSTQYLHMQRFAKGVSKGTQVMQGQTIGYVGSTGLATGPHVCFRFWKNGKQVDHLRENFPPADPMPKGELAKFYMQRDIIKDMLADIDFNKPVIETDSNTIPQISGIIK